MAREKNHSARVQEVLRSRAKSCTTLEIAVFKQLQNPTVCRVLNDEKFLARVREFVAARKKKVRERDQLFERYKVASVRGKQLREVQNSLHSIQKRLESLHQRAKGWISLEGLCALETAIQKVQETGAFAKSAEQSAMALLPPEQIKPHYSTSRWESLVEVFDHSLSKIRDKQSEHRLWKQIDGQLRKHLPRDVTAIARYTLLAVLLDALADGWVEPTAIKQYFYSTKPKSVK